MDFEVNLANLTRDELEEECLHLQKKCKQLCDASDADAQRIHELKRSLATATAAEQYLSLELEQLTANAQQEGVCTKLQTEHEDLRRKHHELSTEFATLQDNYDSMNSENTKLRTQLENLSAEKAKSSNTDSEACNKRLTERVNMLEQENIELLQKLDEQCADKMQQTMALAEKDKKIELMKDEVSCLEENMRFKREELEEKTRMLESAQEQLFEANSKINMLMSSPDNKDRKGNSLFAEVDDQRQVMKQLLAAQKKSYQEMKKIYNESQYEIRRLKRENSAMHTELQACSSIFCNADRTYQEKLNNRIKHLMNQNDDLEQKLKWMQQHLKDLASDKGVLWLDSMLNFCKQETDDLKKQVHSLLIKNASVEEQLRNVQQDMVRWRFEALKSRCLLINRENLLTENNIPFKPQNEVEYKITEIQEKTACPRIVPAEKLNTTVADTSTMPMDKSINDTATSSKPEETFETVDPKNSDSTPTIWLDESIECNKENSASTVCKVKTSPTPIIKSEEKTRKVLQDVSPKIQIKSVETLNAEVKHENLEEKSQKQQLTSILCKQRDVINLCAEKNVKFSTNEATVYNLPAVPEPVMEAEQSNFKDEATVQNDNNANTNAKPLRTKSNVIVRRFVVGSKHK